MQYTIPRNTTAVQGIPIGRLNNLESRVSALEQGGGGGGLSLLVATGTVNGSNTSFTFASAPSIIVVDSVPRQKTQSDGTVNWTGTTSVTLSIAPNFDIFGM